MYNSLFDFYKNKKVLLTGHTGFKGSWLTKILLLFGAEVTGYSLEPPTTPSLFGLSGLDSKMTSIIGDVRNYDHLKNAFNEIQPEIVLHLAAQPIVRESYKNPRYTYETNVMGTVNICEAVRVHHSVKSFLNVTTDKVYHNNEWCYGYRENEPLNGYDPYSNSKSCSELVTQSYINSFFNKLHISVSTARAGNVIGGGDFAMDRIIADCVRAAGSGQPLVIRNPNSTRPYQHVLEPLFTYLTIAAKQYEYPSLAGFYNVGPDECDCVTTGKLVQLFEKYWNNENSTRDEFTFRVQQDPNALHEANFLKLDCSLIKSTFDWKPTWHIESAIEKTVEWSKIYLAGGGVDTINAVMEKEIKDFMKEYRQNL